MRARRTDKNQVSIVKELRSMGYSVAVTSGAGDGFPDLVVGHAGSNYLFELKDPNKPPSKQRLTPAQVIFHSSWQGQINKVNSIQEIHSILQR